MEGRLEVLDYKSWLLFSGITCSICRSIPWRSSVRSQRLVHSVDTCQGPTLLGCYVQLITIFIHDPEEPRIIDRALDVLRTPQLRLDLLRTDVGVHISDDVRGEGA